MNEETKTNLEEQQTINAIETEESSSYDPFKAAKEMDDEFIAEREKANNPPAPETKAEQPKAEEQPKGETAQKVPQETQRPGINYSPEQIAHLEAMAKKGEEYDRYFQSPEGQEDLRHMAISRKKEKEAAEMQRLSEEEREAKMWEDMFGDYTPQAQGLFKNLIRKEAQKLIAREMGGALQEVRNYQNDRISREKAQIQSDFAEHIQDVYGMPAEDANTIADYAMKELSLRMPYNKDAYKVELAVFADNELARINKQMLAKSRNDEIEQLKAKIAELEGASKEVPPSSTAVAAERVLTGRDAAYKSEGGIPTGRNGGGATGEDESDAAIAFFHNA